MSGTPSGAGVMMGAAELRKAAETLREQASAATQGPWHWGQYRDDLPFLVGRMGDPDSYEWEQQVIEAEHHGECGCRSACHLEMSVRPEDQAYIATMHPGVGLALADWLDSVSRVDLGRGQRETHEGCDNDCDVVRALVVARLINGGAE